jgi:hypothetical protein
LCMLSFDGFSLTSIAILVIRLHTPSPIPERGLMCCTRSSWRMHELLFMV